MTQSAKSGKTMNDCCDTSRGDTTWPRKHRCPVNGLVYAQVPTKTLLHHINRPWTWIGREQGYYFCDDPECDVVYFGEDDSQIRRQDLRTPVGVKQHSPDALLCYCFGVSRSDAANCTAARDYVVHMVREGMCACATSHPSGRCCLKDFPNGKRQDNPAAAD